MLRHATRSRNVELLDFLAPTLISHPLRSVSKIALRQKYRPLGTVDTSAISSKFRNQQIVGIDVLDSDKRIFNERLVSIRQALQDINAPRLLEHWQILEQRGLLKLLQPSDVEAIAEFMAKSVTNGTTAIRKAVEEAVVLLAVQNAPDALDVYMFSRIRNNDPETVIRLYTRFMNGLGGQEIWADVVDEESGAGKNSSADGSQRNRIPFIPGRVSILLSVITAHAMRNTFTDALRTSLESVIRFHPYTTTKFLNSLGNDPVLKGKVREYVQKLDLARMIARPPSFSKEITNLAHSRNATRLEKLYEDVLHGLTGPGAYLAANPSLATTSRSVALTEVGWTSFLVAFLQCDRQDLAAKLWDDMGRLGLKPSVSMWTALLDAYGSANHFDKALGAWRMMKAQGIQPDALTYRAMISNLFNASRKEEAMSYFREFQTHSMASASDAHRLSVYNTTLRGLLRGQHIKEVELLVQEMDTKGPAPDLVSYNTLLAYHARRSDFRALAAIVNRMTAVGITGDVFSFSTILSALLKVGKKDAPTMILKLMDKQGVQPSVATYTAIIDHLMREKSEQHVRAAFDMLHSMEQHSKVKPNDVTYTAILGGLYRGAWLAPEKAAAWRERAMTQIQARGIVFGLPTYHILLRTSFDYPREEGLHTALAYYTEMKRLKIKFVDTTWYILLAGLLQRGEWGVAEEVVQDMYASGVVPGGSLLGLVEKIRTRE